MRPLLLLTSILAITSTLPGEEAPDARVARDDQFPDASAAKYIAGEIILVEHVNRIGILRPERDGTINKYFWDLPHEFRMLPYGAIFLHGAPAELKDLPLGIHVHGQFYLGPEGEYEVKPPVSGYVAGNMAKPDMRAVTSPYSRVLRLEDDFSFYQRQGTGWKIVELAEDLTSVTMERVRLTDGSIFEGGDADGGLAGRQVFRLDRGCRIWKEAAIGKLEDLAPGQVVQVNLGWVSLLGSEKQDGLCREIWIDEASREAAMEQQRQIHIAHQKRRGVAALVVKTESMPGEGARGHMTVELAAGLDPELVEEVKTASSVAVWAVEPTLRGYDNDSKPASQLEVTEIESPPGGSSGVRIRMHLYEMLEGFRKGRAVRIAPGHWPTLARPLEERLWQKDTRIFSVGPKPVADRDGPPR